ncbi:hypothetical protein [Natrononativus amylolyticus]|uniref:hypothetical protein n=1 Tax=Natrononativus amylolyticus TaxID=2963434 RepID=UPI0020CBC950|nr:hypothetical protein [Natrononativus amylolyticus]
MSNTPNRRRFLQLAGVGATASVAGCSQLNLDDDETSDDGNENATSEEDQEPGIDPTDGITAIVQPNQEELAPIEQELGAVEQEYMALTQSEEADEEELEALQDRYEELYTEYVEIFEARSAEFESDVEDDDELSIEGAIADQGVFLLEASDERLVDTLRNGEVDGLVPGGEYEQIRQQGEEAEADPDPET